MTNNTLQDVAEDSLPETARSPSWAESPRFNLITPAALTDEARADWDEIRSSSVHYRSPFFSHQFISHVARLQPNIEISVTSQGGQSIAFLPFQRLRRSHAIPVGAGINDAHGLLLRDNVRLELQDMIQASGLKSFSFHASPISCPGVAQFECGRTRSFLADLTADPRGYAHFLCGRNRTIDRQPQKTRRMVKDVGPLRFEFDCRDERLLARLIELKRDQYKRTHTFDIFSVKWIRELLFGLHEDRQATTRGILNVLFAGEQPVALHFGLLEGNFLHYWFPVYDPRFAFGSPGTELFLQIVRQSALEGIVAIDMGYGEQAYKHKLTNVQSEMSFGLVDPSPFRRGVYNAKVALKARLKKLSLRNRLKPLARKLLPDHGRSDYGQ